MDPASQIFSKYEALLTELIFQKSNVESTLQTLARMVFLLFLFSLFSRFQNLIQIVVSSLWGLIGLHWMKIRPFPNIDQSRFYLTLKHTIISILAPSFVLNSAKKHYLGHHLSPFNIFCKILIFQTQGMNNQHVIMPSGGPLSVWDFLFQRHKTFETYDHEP